MGPAQGGWQLVVMKITRTSIAVVILTTIVIITCQASASRNISKDLSTTTSPSFADSDTPRSPSSGSETKLKCLGSKVAGTSPQQLSPLPENKELEEDPSGVSAKV